MKASLLESARLHHLQEGTTVGIPEERTQWERTTLEREGKGSGSRATSKLFEITKLSLWPKQKRCSFYAKNSQSRLSRLRLVKREYSLRCHKSSGTLC